ncbi:MAG: zf-HC2 domain-containing protein [Rubrivivax sp.]|nr:zf-HC2 domain-containing protein [Rubrivivax sp.]
MTAPAPEPPALTCKEVARLLSDGQDRDLPAVERTRLKLHLAICTACRNVEQQFDFIRRAMKRLGAPDDPG